MINQVTLLGRVGKDPEIRYTKDNQAVAMFSIATNEMGKDKPATWHNVQAWEGKAELVEKYVKKGDLLYIQGKIKYTEKDGKYYTAIVIHTMQFLSSKGEKQSSASNKDKPVPKPPTGQKPPAMQETAKTDDLGDDDIPF